MDQSNKPFRSHGEYFSEIPRPKSLHFTNQFKAACKNRVIFVCVDTPDNEGKPDLKNFNSCIRSILKYGKTNTLIVTKSTIPLGTNSKVETKLARHNLKHKANFKKS